MAFERFDLNGKAALITGAAGLLGVEHAYALLECGATVVLTDIDAASLYLKKSILGRDYPDKRIIIEVMDVTSPNSIQSVADRLKSSGRMVEILVNNAAIDPKVKGDQGVVDTSRLENFELEQWNLQLAVGLTGAFLCSQIFGTAMAHRPEGGVIINIASDLSLIAPDHRLYQIAGLAEDQQPVKPVTYSVIKTGLIGLTRYLATYWADKGVRCNALSPGGIFNGQSKEFVNKLTELIPLGRMANIDEYRAAIQFLCSDASAYMNGHNFVMDGGRSIL